MSALSAMKNYGLPKKLLKLGLNQMQNCFVGCARLVGKFDFPVPPNSSIRKTSAKTIRAYYLGGLRTYLPIATCARREGIRLDENIRILDFGCGVARGLLHFTRDYPAPSYFACDIDDTSIAFIQKNYPQVQACVNRFSPPLPYEPGFFDMIYSVSIFSHLNMEDQASWLKELARVTKAGGWCFLSTEGLVSLRLRFPDLGPNELQSLRQRLLREGFLYEEYADWQENVLRQDTLRVTSVLVGVERSYGTTVLAPDFIKRHWPDAGFEVRAIVEGVVDGQDLVVLRRV
jgi:SAM-dependent methyltransferase